MRPRPRGSSTSDLSHLDTAILASLALSPRRLAELLALEVVRAQALRVARRRAGLSAADSADETVKERLQALRRSGRIEYDRATTRWIAMHAG